MRIVFKALDGQYLTFDTSDIALLDDTRVFSNTRGVTYAVHEKTARRIRDLLAQLRDETLDAIQENEPTPAGPPAPSPIKQPTVDDIRLFGMVDRSLSEMKHILDTPEQYDSATFQTMKHHLEDLDLFLKYAVGKMRALGQIRSLPPVAAQQERGY